MRLCVCACSWRGVAPLRGGLVRNCGEPRHSRGLERNCGVCRSARAAPISGVAKRAKTFVYIYFNCFLHFCARPCSWRAVAPLRGGLRSLPRHSRTSCPPAADWAVAGPAMRPRRAGLLARPANAQPRLLRCLIHVLAAFACMCQAGCMAGTPPHGCAGVHTPHEPTPMCPGEMHPLPAAGAHKTKGQQQVTKPSDKSKGQNQVTTPSDKTK
jgi:hypothetical protein